MVDHPTTVDASSTAEMMRRYNQLRAADGFGGLTLPAEHFVLMRAVFLLIGLLGQLRARGTWLDVAREWLFGNEPATDLGREEQAFFAGRHEGTRPKGARMNPIQRAVVEDIVRQTGRHDKPHLRRSPGDPGLTGPGSMSWEINGDIASVVLGGLGAIVMEILHPSVMAGVQDSRTTASSPGGAARTTFGYVVTTTFANTPRPKRLVGAVKRMHGQVNGVRPDGIPYRALDPELIGWVHTCIPWAVMTAYERYNRRSGDERDRYLREQAVIGRSAAPATSRRPRAELRDVRRGHAPEARGQRSSMEFFEFLMSMPSAPPMPGPLSGPVHRFRPRPA